MTTKLSEESRRKLATISTATLTTCLFKRGFRRQFIDNVQLINPDAPRMVGEAYTLRYIPAREDIDVLEAYEDWEHPQRKAIEACPSGHVLIMDSRKDARAASAGDILITRLMVRGVAGVVTDGGFRDTPTLSRLDFPAYHQRPSAPTGPIHHHAAETEVPIGCGDAPVFPGDIIVGDGEGVVVIPAVLSNEIAEEAFEMTAYEDFVGEKVKEGRRIFGIYPATEASREEFQNWRRANNR